jgi:hypothetical protein
LSGYITASHCQVKNILPASLPPSNLDFAPFNGDPEKLKKHVVNPGRVYVLAPGEPFVLKKLKQMSKK